VPLGIAVGLELKGGETRVIGGPASAVRKNGDYILEIVPGKFNQNDISKKIYRIYADELNDPRFVKQIASPDQVAMMIPAGESDIRSQKPERKGKGVGFEGEEYETPGTEAGFEDSEGETDEEFIEEAGEGIEVEIDVEAREGSAEGIEKTGVKKV